MADRRGLGARTAGAGMALLLFAGIAVLAFRSTVGFEEDARRVSHTHAVQLDIEELRGRFSRMHLHWRLYAASGNPGHLSSFELDHRRLPAEIDQLRRTTADNPKQQRRLDALDAVLQADLRDEPTLIEVMRIAREMKEEEDLLLYARETQSAASAQFTKGVIVFGNLLALTLLGATLWLLARENRERRRAELDAQRYSAELEDLYNHAPCGYHSVDADGLVVRINDTWLSWLGYTREEVLGRMRHPDLMTEASAAHFRDTAFPLFRRQGWLKDAEFEYRRRDGTTFPALVSASTIVDENGAYRMSRSTVFDITDRKKIEADLRAANAELESFSYSVSHDLRAPLRAVNGYAQMLEEDYSARLDDEGRRLLATVRQSAARMGRLIDDLLAFSRLGRQPLACANVDMTNLAQQALDELAGANSPARLALAPLPPAHGDRTLLRQVWANLIGNALKYSSKAAQPLVDISGRREKGECVYSVCDNGAGFDMRYYGKLFGVFQRLHGDSEYEGTGVGLAIVQRIVARHGGRVWAQGEPGRGATFHFALPETGFSDV